LCQSQMHLTIIGYITNVCRQIILVWYCRELCLWFSSFLWIWRTQFFVLHFCKLLSKYVHFAFNDVSASTLVSASSNLQQCQGISLHM
jgi:hypothetical protein